jgi:hypothetical protein
MEEKSCEFAEKENEIDANALLVATACLAEIG